MLKTVFQWMLTSGMECSQTTIGLFLGKQQISEDAMKLRGVSFPKRFNLTFKVVIYKKIASKSQSLKKSIKTYYTQFFDLSVTHKYCQNKLHLNWI